MALSIVLIDSVQCPTSPPEHVGDFNENEASFWFLYPLWEQLQHKSGQLIDLYGLAFFGGTDLDFLAQTLRDARLLTQAQEENWEVVVGWNMRLGKREVKEPLSKLEINALLDVLEGALAKAKRESLYVIFLGD